MSSQARTWIGRTAVLAVLILGAAIAVAVLDDTASDLAAGALALLVLVAAVTRIVSTP